VFQKRGDGDWISRADAQRGITGLETKFDNLERRTTHIKVFRDLNKIRGSAQMWVFKLQEEGRYRIRGKLLKWIRQESSWKDLQEKARKLHPFKGVSKTT